MSGCAQLHNANLAHFEDGVMIYVQKLAARLQSGRRYRWIEETSSSDNYQSLHGSWILG